MLKFIGINDIDRKAWDDLVKSSAVASWFQTKEAYAFFSSLSFLETFALAVENDGQLKGVIVGYVQKEGGMLKQFFSRRAIILGGPLLANNIVKEELVKLLNELRANLKRKVIYIEIRNFNDYGGWSEVYEECGFKYEPHYDVLIDTSSVDAINGRLDRNRKRNIKKAVENGLVIEQELTEKEVRQFYSMLTDLYREKVKTPLFPLSFFLELYKTGLGHFFIAKNAQGELIGGLVCVALADNTVYAWYACGDDQNYKQLSPSVMVNYSGICYAAEHGYSKFDFMGAGKPDDGGYGVRDFKLKFGGELVEYGRNVFVCNPVLFELGKLGVKLLKRI